MKILIIETTPATPHAETAIEIAVKESIVGSSVIYCPIFHLFPNLLWRSNINGRNDSGKVDSLEEWLTYLIDVVSPYAEIDLFKIDSLPNYLSRDIIDNIFGFTYDDHPFGAVVKANAIEIYKTNNLDEILKAGFNTCLNLALTCIIAYELTLLLIEKHKPKRIVFFNGRTAGSYPIFSACEKFKIPCWIHERGSTKDSFAIWDSPPQYIHEIRNKINKFAENRDPYLANLSAGIFYNRQWGGALTALGPTLRPKNIELSLGDLGIDEKYVTFYTSSNWEFATMPNEDWSNELGDQYETAALLANVCSQQGVQLVIRMHPNTAASEYYDYTNLEDAGLCRIIRPDADISSYELGRRAFRNFSYGSTITWEFMYSGIQCAVLSNSFGRGAVGVIELNSADGISNYLNNELLLVDKSFPIKYADFHHNLGERYDFYHAETLFSGCLNFELRAKK